MAKLHFLLDGHALDVFNLDQERMTIGRRTTNHIHIDNLAVSGVHAAIVTIGNDSFLEDLNSTNGTLVNGKTIKKHVLQHEDVIEIGQYQLQYMNEHQIVNASEAFEKTVFMPPIKNIPEDADVSVEHPQPVQKIESVAINTAQGSEQPSEISIEEHAIVVTNIARLQVLNGASAGRELLLNKTMTTLGKPGSQVAVITKRPHGYYITHVGGSTYPMINGQTIGAQAHELNHQDVLELAGIRMEFHVT